MDPTYCNWDFSWYHFIRYLVIQLTWEKLKELKNETKQICQNPPFIIIPNWAEMERNASEKRYRCPSPTINNLWNFLFPHELSLSLYFIGGIKVKIHIFPSISLPFGNQTKEISDMFFSFLFSLPTSQETRGKHFLFLNFVFSSSPNYNQR